VYTRKREKALPFIHRTGVGPGRGLREAGGIAAGPLPHALVEHGSAGWLVYAWPGGGAGSASRSLPAWRDLLPDRLRGSRRPVEVLIVEDDQAIAEMYRIQLVADGYRVRVVGTATDALTAIDRREPDLVLLDVLLPGRDGFAVLEHLRQALEPAPPVVILSNYGEPSMVDRGLSLGAIDYFVKSRVTPDIVSRSIPEWLQRARGTDD
jgi:CheY-like chemotaxis protein